MAKKKSKKKEDKKKSIKLKLRKKKDAKKKDSKKKNPKKKDLKKKSEKQKSAKKKDVEKSNPVSKLNVDKPQTTAKSLPKPPVTGNEDRSLKYNVKDAIKKLRTLKSKDALLSFTRGENRVTVKRIIPAAMNRLK